MFIIYFILLLLIQFAFIFHGFSYKVCLFLFEIFIFKIYFYNHFLLFLPYSISVLVCTPPSRLTLSVSVCLSVCLSGGRGIELRNSFVLSKCFATECHPRPWLSALIHLRVSLIYPFLIWLIHCLGLHCWIFTYLWTFTLPVATGF